ncbi:hypothetical protein HYV50_05850 [Candidatus Pacearchaeota archaeon]|nr:hypothetical protein [Candidatus Pacearchaeota archaeon]
MRIRIRKQGVLGFKRIRFDGKLEKIEKLERKNNPETRLGLFFKGPEGSGVISLSEREVKMISEKGKIFGEKKTAKEESRRNTERKVRGKYKKLE